MSNSEKINFPLVALVGAPNSGKTTLYNWLTNSNFKTVNYPGATVEYSIGRLSPECGADFLVMDTPGTYSLFPQSADEIVTLRALYDGTPQGQTKKVVVVCDATQMDRHLVLAKQIQMAGFAMVMVLTMCDLFEKNKLNLNTKKLEEEFGCPVVRFDGIKGIGLKNVSEALRQIPEAKAKMLMPMEDEKSKKLSADMATLADVVTAGSSHVALIYDKTAKLDRWLLHPFLGVLIFFLVMSGLFSSIYWMAKPMMEFIDHGLSWGADFIKNYGQGALWSEFLSGGIIASFSSVLVFVPQIFILFLLVSFLESSGYLARAATLIDRPFSWIGLSGRSFVPLLSGFACAVPAMMATRNITSSRDRLITTLVIPLTTCSARLPVYLLLLGFLYQDQPAWKAGFVLATLYFVSLILSSFSAAVLNKIISNQSEKSHFMMELPLYRKPRVKVQIIQAWNRTKSYVFRAGPVIFTLAVVLWVSAHFPYNKDLSAEQQIEQSYLGRVGQVLEPALKPMGLDWKVGVGLLSAFAAREVFVSTMAVVYQVTGDEDTQQEGLLKAMAEAKKSDGQPVFTGPSVVALILFFMIALQCLSTFAIAIREMGSAKWALGQLIGLNLVAYLLAVTAYQTIIFFS